MALHTGEAVCDVRLSRGLFGQERMGGRGAPLCIESSRGALSPVWSIPLCSRLAGMEPFLLRACAKPTSSWSINKIR